MYFSEFRNVFVKCLNLIFQNENILRCYRWHDHMLVCLNQHQRGRGYQLSRVFSFKTILIHDPDPEEASKNDRRIWKHTMEKTNKCWRTKNDLSRSVFTTIGNRLVFRCRWNLHFKETNLQIVNREKQHQQQQQQQLQRDQSPNRQQKTTNREKQHQQQINAQYFCTKWSSQQNMKRTSRLKKKKQVCLGTDELEMDESFQIHILLQRFQIESFQMKNFRLKVFRLKVFRFPFCFVIHSV